MKTKPFVVGVLFLASLALATTTAWAGKRPNPYRGKSVYKATCKLCHVEGGEAKNLAPLSKTQAQWKRLFDNAKKIGACVERVEKKCGTKLSEEDLRNISFFLISHAADSDQPETCGE
ncbi:MAG TPA: cytochrome c [Acidobacteria bacterium]|nr:cytochrome c [Acidobacteriota bacterium]